MEIIKVVTHSGVFHADEVFAIALLKVLLDENQELEITRTRDKVVLDEALANNQVIVIDVGGLNDRSMMNFDHHQDPNMWASNMLLLEVLSIDMDVHVKSALLELFAPISNWDTNHNNVINTWDKNSINISQIIASFNDFNNPKAFDAALGFAVEIVKNYIRKGEEYSAQQKIWDNREELSKDTVAFVEFCSIWKDKGGYKYAIQPNPQGYALMSADSNKWPLEHTEHEDLIFAHKGKFIAIYKTMKAAVNVAMQQ